MHIVMKFQLFKVTVSAVKELSSSITFLLIIENLLIPLGFFWWFVVDDYVNLYILSKCKGIVLNHIELKE
ncbi:9650_t:CDS:2 [Diversispora eburnea]|uniref:9650_t:CDS:1 n=1 Tax=Diversispora eburnea TaxID=1213867 RepID=A0A9N8ZUS8_9GLOM|nr:9650_t:CDS:2 [Diversispora eburnea]